MNSALVLCVYFAMVMSPCMVAQWGDLLNTRWMFALARRRRTHPRESFLTSFRHERYVMAVALEASFATADLLEVPKPFLVPERAAFIQTEAFLEGKQRVAARLAQLAVAQKLRNLAAEEKIVALPADVPAADMPAVFAAAAALQNADGLHLRPRKASAAYERQSVADAVPVAASAPLQKPARTLAEVIAIGPARTAPDSAGGVAARKPGESDEVIVAA